MVLQAGDTPSAAELRALGETVQTIEKTADEALASNTTMQTDDELLFDDVELGTWEFEGEIWYTGTSAAAADIKIRFYWPSGSGGTFTWHGIGLHVEWANSATNRDVEINGGLRITTSPSAQAEFGTVTSQTRVIKVSGRMTNLAVGDFGLSWAQNTSHATATTVKAGSWVTLRKVA